MSRFEIKYLLFLLVFVLSLVSSCKEDKTNWDTPGTPQETIGFYTGMDLSYQSFLDPYQVPYKDEAGNEVGDLFDFTAKNGVSLVRIRLFHTPEPDDPVVFSSNFQEVKKLCLRITDAGSKILLDLHFSDFWADPGKQNAPEAWQELEFDEVVDSVYDYTHFILSELRLQNTLPFMVQIGNETNPGFVWEYGRIGNNYTNKQSFVALVNSAQDAIDDLEKETGKTIYSMVHYAGVLSSDAYFTNVFEYKGRFDIIGLSHYLLWHSKDLNQVEAALSYLSINQKKPVMIVEMFYPWTLEWNDWTHNWVGNEDQLIEGYPATPAGQAEFYERMTKMVMNLPEGRGIGTIWWAPDLVAFNGPQSTSGSFMENLTTFDFDNEALPVFEVFRTY